MESFKEVLLQSPDHCGAPLNGAKEGMMDAKKGVC